MVWFMGAVFMLPVLHVPEAWATAGAVFAASSTANNAPDMSVRIARNRLLTLIVSTSQMRTVGHNQC